MDTQNPLIAFDRMLFSKINLDWTNGFFDWLLPAITDLHKDPRALVVLLPLLVFWFWKQKYYAIRAMTVLILSIGMADLFTYRVVKAAVQRDRPEFAELQTMPQLRTHQHSGTSFPSNHAANVFAAAQVMTLAVPVVGPALYVVAFGVAYSRVYVGVHFPLDVFCGGLIGVTIATLMWIILGRWVRGESSIRFRSGANSSRARS